MSLFRKLCSICIFYLIVAFISPGYAQGGVPDRSGIRNALDEILAEKNFAHSLVGIHVVSLKHGDVVYSRNATLPMVPASNLKLVTTAAILNRLGPDYRFTTLLKHTGKIENGVLDGHLIAIGFGDPAISGRFNDGDRTATLRRWVDEVKKLGIKKVQGHVIGDDDYWTDDDYAAGWDWKQAGEWYCAPSSALSFNDNCVDIIWSPASKLKQPASWRTEPPVEYLEIISEVITRRKGTRADRDYHRRMDSRTVRVTGGIDINEKEDMDSASVNNPTLYFATVLCDLLEKAGIEVTQGPADIDDFENKQPLRKGRVKIAEHRSPPLAEIIAVTNKRSQNLYAEQLFRALGKRAAREGSFRAGERAARTFLRAHRVSTLGLNMADGSGLSYKNSISPKTLADMLVAMRKHKHADVYMNSLPHGREAETSLYNRFEATWAQQKISSRVHAKSGYTSMARALSGYVANGGKEEFAFSIIFNHYTGGPARTWLDRMVTLIATNGKSQ